MRYLTYVFLALGGALATAAVIFFFFDTAEPEAVQPQGETVVAVPAPDDDPANGDQSEVDATAQEQDTENDSAEAAVAQADPAGGSGLAYGLEIDVARVKPDGEAVFAGQGAPGAEISVVEGNILLGRTTDEAHGEWVVILEKPLAPGEHLISVAMETPDGETSLADVTLAIKIDEEIDTQPLVALLPQTEVEAPKLLQSPDDVAPDSAPEPQDAVSVSSLAPRALIWKDDNILGVSGVSRGGIRVTGKIEGALFSETLVLADGQWQLSGPVAQSQQKITLDFALFEDGGQVVATYKLPITKRDLDVGLDGSEMVVVQSGDALWRIAYRSYGKGVRYVDIVRRNAAAINDPDLIYPNQIFAIPK